MVAEAGVDRGRLLAPGQVGLLAPRQVVVGPCLLHRLLRVEEVGEVGHEVVRRRAVAGAGEPGRALAVELDAGALDPLDRDRGRAAGDHLRVDRRDDADVAGAHRPHRPDGPGDVGVEEGGEPRRTALDQLLHDQVGRPEPELRGAARGVVDLGDHHRVRLRGGVVALDVEAGQRPGLGELRAARDLLPLGAGLGGGLLVTAAAGQHEAGREQAGGEHGGVGAQSSHGTCSVRSGVVRILSVSALGTSSGQARPVSRGWRRRRRRASGR